MYKRLLVAVVGLIILLLAAVPALAPEQGETNPTATEAPQVAARNPSTPPQASTISASAKETPSPVPATATPRPETFPAGSSIAGVKVGGLTREAAYKEVSAALARLRRPVQLKIGATIATIATADLVKLPDPAKLVERATAMARQTTVNLPLQAQVDREQLQARLERLLSGFEQAPATAVITDAEAITQTFTFAARPGITVDIDRAVDQVASAIVAGPARSLTLSTTVALPPRPPLAELQPVIEEHTGYWKGITGLYVHDLETGETIGHNADTVFSGASVMKVPIMIFAYSRLGTLNEEQREWLRLVIDKSENLEANYLLAAAIGGEGTEDSLVAVGEMSAMLQELGLRHTYMIIPYESGEYLIQISRLPKGGPAQEGAPPYTEADPYLRTTPSEMGRLFVMLAQCAEGNGPLIEKFGERLNAKVCQEMIRWLESPHDEERMVAGIPPEIPVAHKGGWTDDFQGDVGIVRSPGGRYVAAIYIYRDSDDGYVTNPQATPSPYLGDFSHTIYTFFNPVPFQSLPQAKPENDAAED